MKTLISIILFTLCFSAYSQDSLMNYLEIAAKNNPLVLQRYNEYLAALQKVPQVGSLQDPELNVGVFLSPMELIAGNQVADIRLMQMFPWFGVLKNAKDEMSLMAKAKYESLRDAKLQLFYDVQRSWFELQKVQQDIGIAEKNIQILRTLERLSLVKFKSVSTTGGSSASSGSNMSTSGSQNTTSGASGMNRMGGGNSNPSFNSPSPSMQNNGTEAQAGSSGLADLYRIQIEIGELDNNIALLKNQQKTTQARFNTYLNRAPKTPVILPDSIKADTLFVSLASVSDSMLAQNPMLSMLQYEEKSYDARKKMVTRMGYPMVGVGVNYTLINKSEMSTSPMNGKDMIMPMVTVTLPIYRKKYKAMQTEAELQKIATQQGYLASENSLQAEYYEAIQLYQDAERRMKLYRNQSELAKKSFDIMVKSFSVSGSGLTDVLRVRQQMLDYDTKQVEAIADNNTAIAWLKRLGSIN